MTLQSCCRPVQCKIRVILLHSGSERNGGRKTLTSFMQRLPYSRRPARIAAIARFDAAPPCRRAKPATQARRRKLDGQGRRPITAQTQTDRAGPAETGQPEFGHSLPHAGPAAPETRRLYAGDWAAFRAWCLQHGEASLPATPATVAVYLQTALVHFDGVNDGRRLFPFFGPDRTDAAQAQRRPPSPHPEDVVQGAELAGLRSRSAPTWQPNGSVKRLF